MKIATASVMPAAESIATRDGPSVVAPGGLPARASLRMYRNIAMNFSALLDFKALVGHPACHLA
ncbi:MAG: hypothetical protein VW516_13040, partial [Rhodospirillaceae bacterium]